MKEITTDNFSFEKLRKSDVLYVDKTQYIWDLVKSKTFMYFLSRPRRFGKSLTISTLEAFFKGKRELFKGLAIDRLAPDDAWQQWPVIHLDMAQASSSLSLEESKLALKDYIADVAESYGITATDSDLPAGLLRKMILHLHQSTGKQVVVLIDEYDKPILDALHTTYIQDVVAMMQSFYQVLKSNVDKERFVFITGVTKFAHTSLFSGFNNPTDITQRTEFATMLGYTEQELRDNFAEYIDATAVAMNIDREALIEQMKWWYDGFRFTANSGHVFNPVSVGKFFQEKEFQNYWFATGTPTFLVKCLKNNPFQLHDFTEKFVDPMTFDSFEVNTIDPVGLAIQTGYLTIAEVQKDIIGTAYRYDFPNEEIRVSWNRDMMKYITAGTVQANIIKRDFLTPLIKGDVDAMMKVMQSIFAGVTKDHLGKVQEGYYRNMMYMLFTAFGVDCHAEEQVAGGRVDIVVKAYDQAYVFELKVAKTEADEDVAKCLEKGIDQATRNHYADKYHFGSATVHVVAVTFEREHHQLVAWRELN